jgi:hypothetical protein
MKKIISTALLSVLILGGCSKIMYLVVYNNSNLNITITFETNGTRKSFPVKNKEKIKLLCPSFADKAYIHFDSGKKELEYKLEWPGNKFIQESFFEYELFFQFESDMAIYVLGSEILPCKQIPKQPKGFPLKPILSKETAKQFFE